MDTIDSSIKWLVWLLPSSDVDRGFDLRSGQNNNVLCLSALSTWHERLQTNWLARSKDYVSEWRDLIKQTQRIGLVQDSIFQKRVVRTKSYVYVWFTSLPSHQKVNLVKNDNPSLIHLWAKRGYGEHIVYVIFIFIRYGTLFLMFWRISVSNTDCYKL